MLVTLTTDFGKVLDGMHRTKIRGNAHLATGLQIAAVRPPSILLAMVAHFDNVRLACTQTPPKQLTKTANHRFYMFGDTRRGKGADQTREEAEEGQHIGRYRCVWRPGPRQYEEARGLQPGGQFRGGVTLRSHPTRAQSSERPPTIVTNTRRGWVGSKACRRRNWWRRGIWSRCI